jgi:hypothetical protein
MIYTGLKHQGETPLNYKYTFFFKDEGWEGKMAFPVMGGKGVDIWKG